MDKIALALRLVEAAEKLLKHKPYKLDNDTELEVPVRSQDIHLTDDSSNARLRGKKQDKDFAEFSLKSEDFQLETDNFAQGQGGYHG